MEAVALRNEVHGCLDALPDDELTLDGKTLDDLRPEYREVFLRKDDPSFYGPAFKTAAEATAWALSQF